MTRPVTLYIGLGSNLGRRRANLARAMRLLNARHYRLKILSPMYETSPVGPRQRNFVNAVAVFFTTRRPEDVLGDLKEIERAMGRRQARRWGPRIIDLDILFYGRCIFRSSRLIVPHPDLHRRRFVLEPLAEIAPRFVHPMLKTTLRKLRDRLVLTSPDQKVRIKKWIWKRK